MGMDQSSSPNNGIPKLALTRVEAAQALGIKPLTLYRLEKRGLLHPSRATRRPLYAVAELERFLRDTTAQGDV
jgi:DNA-binding transcriptional MerR regulator